MRPLEIGLALGLLLVCRTPGVAAGETERNACGCYPDGAGNCFCDKKARCGCPGQCEPKGCEQQREKQLEREIQAETKRAQQSQRDSEGKGEDQAGAPAPQKAPPPQAASPAQKLTARQRHDLARLLETYLGGVSARRAMSADEILQDLAGTSASSKR